MADDKKNIDPEAGKPGETPQVKEAELIEDTPPAPEQPVPGTSQATVVETAPKVQTASTVESQPEEKAAPAEKPKQPRDKMLQSKKVPGKEASIPPKLEAAPKEAKAPEQEKPAIPRDATRSVKPEQIVYINLHKLYPFKNRPFGVRDDSEMKGLVESVKTSGVNQPAFVRPREDGGYEIIAGHRRQKTSELAGFVNMPCTVRNMTDDEAILAMTDDNLRWPRSG